MKKKEAQTRAIADLCDQIAGGKSESGKQLRAKIRATEKRKRAQFRRKPKYKTGSLLRYCDGETALMRVTGVLKNHGRKENER